MNDDKPFLTHAEACKMIGIHDRTLKAWRADDMGPVYLKFGRIIRYREQDILDWIKSCERNVPAAARKATKLLT